MSTRRTFPRFASGCGHRPAFRWSHIPCHFNGLAPTGSLNPPLVRGRSEEHTSELQSLMRISYAVFCLKKKKLNTEIVRATQCIKDNITTTVCNHMIQDTY